jgi:hypothetical protein
LFEDRYGSKDSLLLEIIFFFRCSTVCKLLGWKVSRYRLPPDVDMVANTRGDKMSKLSLIDIAIANRYS